MGEWWGRIANDHLEGAPGFRRPPRGSRLRALAAGHTFSVPLQHSGPQYFQHFNISVGSDQPIACTIRADCHYRSSSISPPPTNPARLQMGRMVRGLKPM